MANTLIRRSIVLSASLLVLIAISSSASTVIWGGTAQPYSYAGYFVDPTDGSTVPAPGGILTFGATASPYSGWVFATSLLNLWKVPVTVGGTPEYMGTYATVVMADVAFDPGSGILYGTAGSYGSGELYTIDYANFCCGLTLLGASMSGVQALGFGPGGIYGADIGGGIWLLDPKTLQLSFVGGTGIFGITDLAYDSFTRSLIAVSVGIKCYPFPNPCGTETGMIWSIDPQTAALVLLNDNAPPIYGLAALTPEPGSIVMFATGAVGLFAAVRRRLIR